MHTRSLLRQIRVGILGRAATPRYFFGNRGKFFFCARREKHRRALLGEQLRDGPAYSAARAGDQGNLIFEQHRDNEDRREIPSKQGAASDSSDSCGRHSKIVCGSDILLALHILFDDF